MLSFEIPNCAVSMCSVPHFYRGATFKDTKEFIFLGMAVLTGHGNIDVI
jgi:hypothetical protein